MLYKIIGYWLWCLTMIQILLMAAVELAALSWLVPALQRLTATAPVSDAGNVAVLVLHLGATVGVAWLLLATLIDLVAVARHRPPSLTPGFIRRRIVQAVATVTLLGSIAGPASAGMTGIEEDGDRSATPMTRDDLALLDGIPVLPIPDPPVVRQTAGDPSATPIGAIRVTSVLGPPLTTPALVDPPTAPAPAAPPTAPATATPPPDTVPVEEDPAGTGDDGTHVVATGENLWTIARGAVAGAGNPAPHDREVHAYWVRLIAENLPSLRSGDPDLVHPGEVLQLPPSAPTPAAT